jgi:hypothetical protein
MTNKIFGSALVVVGMCFIIGGFWLPTLGPLAGAVGGFALTVGLAFIHHRDA